MGYNLRRKWKSMAQSMKMEIQQHFGSSFLFCNFILVFVTVGIFLKSETRMTATSASVLKQDPNT